MTAKATFQERIKQKTDRELQEDIAYFTNESEKHLRNISNVLNWFFWMFIIGLALSIVVFIIGNNASSAPTI